MTADAYIHKSAKIYGNTEIGDNSIILEYVIIGYPSSTILNKIKERHMKIEDYDFPGATIGNNAIIRSKSIIYCEVTIGNNLKTGHNILVREKSNIGNNVLLGTNVVIEGNTTIGNNVSLQSNVYIPTNTIIEDFVFIGPSAVLTNDKYPIRIKTDLVGPIIRKGASIGANSVILPGVEIGEGAIVGAGSLVTKDIPAWTVAFGSPATVIKDVPESLKSINKI